MIPFACDGELAYTGEAEEKERCSRKKMTIFRTPFSKVELKSEDRFVLRRKVKSQSQCMLITTMKQISTVIIRECGSNLYVGMRVV